jgi:hypothetical protein
MAAPRGMSSIAALVASIVKAPGFKWAMQGTTASMPPIRLQWGASETGLGTAAEEPRIQFS